MDKNKNLTTGIVIVAIIVVVTVAAAFYQQSVTTQTSELVVNEQELNHTNPSNYESGTYEATGNYISPGGAEEIDVTLTIEDGVVVDSHVEPRATRDISVVMQNDFADNYKEFVIGKSIDEVSLTKVSGSSLTPNGFNDAVEKIKGQARS